jgi:protein TonB
VAYARRQKIGASRTFAIAIVALTQASLGYALVNGLAYTVVQGPSDGLKIFSVQEEEPPPPEPQAHHPAPIPKQASESPPRRAAPSAVSLNSAPSPAVTQMIDQSLPEAITAAVAPAAPAPVYPARYAWSPPPAERIPPRGATGDLQSLFRAADYPAAALQHHEQGSVTVDLTVGVMGRVRACDIASSSGSQALDHASCQILRSRASFTPARDTQGNPTIDTVRQEIRWVLRN